MAAISNARTPWHLWLVGLLGIIWNGFGAYDYVMSKTGGEQYLRDFGMTEPQIAYFLAMPAWTTVTWAMGVWGAVLGSVLILARSRFAVWAFAASLFGFLAGLVYQYVLSDGAAIMGGGTTAMNGVIFASLMFFLVYSRAMAAKGHLR